MSNLKYIVFLIDSKNKYHDGKIFSDIPSAKGYIYNNLDGFYFDKAVLGCFVNNLDVKELIITYIQTIEFKKNLKNNLQLNLFQTT
jgi:hypothetical protein